MVGKIIFCSDLTYIPDKTGSVTRRRTQAIAKRFVFSQTHLLGMRYDDRNMVTERVGTTVMRLYLIPNGHTTPNPRRFHVSIMSIRQRPNFDEFPCRFRVLFPCNFAGPKINIISMYFF